MYFSESMKGFTVKLSSFLYIMEIGNPRSYPIQAVNMPLGFQKQEAYIFYILLHLDIKKMLQIKQYVLNMLSLHR